ncbi:la-related protein Larp4B isoform X2 [Anopheles aquasalis]|nr:la-related protein Larp4B isoform X2 [Anopheles aquasalis]
METGGTTDVSFGSDSDSVTGGGAGGGGVDGGGGRPGTVATDATQQQQQQQQGGRKLKLSKLPSKTGGVTLKRVSFGSSKGSMVETLVFETPTPLPEHAEREFCQSPAVLLGAGHTTVHSGAAGAAGAGAAATNGGPLVHHLHHHHHLPGPPQPLHQPYHPSQHTAYQPYHPQQYHPGGGGYCQPDGALAGRLHDDSGIELQEEVERSKVRVTFFQSSKPQSISPPESLHLYGGQNLIHFGAGSVGEGGGGGYDNNNSALDTYITSAALNQQYDALPGHQQQQQQQLQQQQQQQQQLHPDQWNSSMAAVYGVSPSSYNRQMSTESGWDNPFRPGGDLSREADEIVNLIKGGKPITPTGEQSLVNGGTSATDGSSHIDAEANVPTAVLEGSVTKAESAQLQSTQQNGTKSPHKGATTGVGSPATARNGGAAEAATATATAVADGSGPGGAIGQTPISNQVIPGPQSASHVVIDEKKKKKCTCCVIQ